MRERPIVIDLGRRRGRDLRALKRHGGPLLAEVNGVIEPVRGELAGEDAGKILVYRKKSRGRAPGLAPIRR